MNMAQTSGKYSVWVDGNFLVLLTKLGKLEGTAVPSVMVNASQLTPPPAPATQFIYMHTPASQSFPGPASCDFIRDLYTLH